MTNTALPPLRKTTPRDPNKKTLSDYHKIATLVREAGLFKKRPDFYIRRFFTFIILTGGVWTGFAFLQPVQTTWWGITLIIVGSLILAQLIAQFGFIGHEAAHKQVFNNAKANEWAGLIIANLFAGLSYSFWLNKHNKHHAHPNEIGVDPDLGVPIFSFTVEQRNNQPKFLRPLAHFQGVLYPILLMGTGFHLLFDSFHFFKDKSKRNKKAALELVLMVVRQAAPIIGFTLLFGWWGIAYWLLFQLAFGIMLGSSFSINHFGMWLFEKKSSVEFMQRQVLGSRNITPSWFKDNLMGGLNYQIEHHLFPHMARPNLKKARIIVKEYCRSIGLKYHETTLWKGHLDVVKYLNNVGFSGNKDPFVCPILSQYRPTI